ncbi:hypothetical protein L0P88_15860 [Muricauda sp. SCSIO 64092]|uniref:hypothetical protein n=1 Tax=Allomuricauda sp. SCSIO 64092 TaxID=2908842 RepID=UPI001FF41097|nr:hypothetical protein [Muricauda sp. SCSIO 64092]UOY05420.1 hypothetical protein L0P88_15860 [Muricauda sp. SCSIO 64092]
MKQNYKKSPIEILKESTNEEEVHLGVIKGAISAIPFIGAVMNELIFEVPNRIQQKRINETVAILQEKFKVIEKDKIDKEYLESNDFYDFLKEFWRSSLNIRNNQIRASLANVFIDSCINKEDYDLSVNRLFMNFLVDFSPIQVVILRFIDDSPELLDKIETYDNFFKQYNEYGKKVNVDKYEFKYYCIDLYNKGLMTSDGDLRDFGVEDYILYDDRYVKPSVFITDLGNSFIEFIKSGI